MIKSTERKSNSRRCPHCKGKGVIGKSQYHRGRSFEYKVRDYLRDRGWTVFRSYASKGVIDLFTAKNGIQLGIQAKNRKTGAYLTPKENLDLKIFRDTMDNDESSYIMSIWRNHKIESLRVTGVTHVVHAYTIPGVKTIQWRMLTKSNEWVDCSKLIKTGKL